MTTAVSKLPPLLDVPRATLARRCRQLCLQREREGGGSRSFEDLFLEALSSVRDQYGVASLSEEDLWAVAYEEVQRVADAATVAELLLPKISLLLKSHPPSTVPVPTPVPAPASSPPKPEPATEMASASLVEPRGLPASPVGIADLIDGMLDQDRRAPRRPSQRS